MDLLIIVIVGLVAGTFSGLIGGGASLFTTPALLLLGLPPHVSVGTTRLGSTGLMFGSLLRFYKSNTIVWSLVLPFVFLSAVASIVGAYLVIYTPASILEPIIALVLVVSAPLVLVNKSFGVKQNHDINPGFFAYLGVFLSKVLQAAFGTGIGLLVNYAYIHSFGLTFNQANAVKRISGVVMSLITLTIFFQNGIVALEEGLVLLVTMFVGGYLGSHYALKLGNLRVKYLFVGLVVIMGLMLIADNIV